MSQFFYEGNFGTLKEIIFSLEESKHLKVFRVKKGDKIKVFDLYANQRYAIIDGIYQGKFRAILSDKIEFKKKKVFVSLYFPFIERNAFDDLIRKCCEIGADEFTPVITEYTQRNFVFDISTKNKRYKSIIISAVKQCERPDIPALNSIMKFEEVFSKNDHKENIILLSRYDKDDNFSPPLNKVITDMEGKIGIVVGPEGGFSKKELELAQQKGFLAKIGDFVMRTPTAAQSACAIIRAVKDENLL